MEKLKEWKAQRKAAKMKAMEEAIANPTFRLKKLRYDDRHLYDHQQPAQPAAQQPPSKAAAVSSYRFRFQFFF
jgi:hypothetical protein